MYCRSAMQRDQSFAFQSHTWRVTDTRVVTQLGPELCSLANADGKVCL